ncbi:copper homeostasis protein CutC [Marinilactibacillus piezotolerans]|uniref:copper homeostasis protein CutC n=1 Tax=Marinilactibacillus piezotolerans TaxID=258723 RepID=UPI0009AFCEF2|nr:copper homeostasis protein CutC [Marinilactibacillus piezotolerans]
MLKEFCAENYTLIPTAIERGAGRIELCDNLAVGGTTPSNGVIIQVLDYCKNLSIPVVTMVRPRGGDFIYSKQEIHIMEEDVKNAVRLRTDGLVFGCLTAEDRIDRSQMRELLALAGNTEVTFHMAFDQIPAEAQFEEMDWLIEQNVSRILTHGRLGGDITDNLDRLNDLIQYAAGRIENLPGGGINYQNLPFLAEKLQTNQFHGTKIVALNS